MRSSNSVIDELLGSSVLTWYQMLFYCVLLYMLCSRVVCSVGRPKHVRVMAGALEGDLFIGPKAEVTPCPP